MIVVTLEQALSKLDHDNNNHWTQDGLPRVDTLKMLTGDQTLTREIVSAQFPDAKRVTVTIDPVVIQAPVITPPVVIVDTTPKVNDSQIESALDILEQEAEKIESDNHNLDDEIEHLEHLDKLHRQAFDRFKEQQAFVDSIIASRKSNVTPAQDAQEAIRLYLNSQQLVRDERERKMTILRDSGLDVKKLAEDLVAPVDRKKSKRRQ
jgi:exonuclease VII small subunit